MTTKEIESRLKELLDECLASANQEGSILNLEYDRINNQCIVALSVVEVPEDDYIGFQGY